MLKLIKYIAIGNILFSYVASFLGMNLPGSSTQTLLLVIPAVTIQTVISLLLYVVANRLEKNLKQIKNTITDLHQLRQALDSASNHIIITDADGKITYANSAAEKMTGYSFTEMKGNTPKLWGGQMSKDFYVMFWNQIKILKQPYHGEFTNIRKSGEKYPAIATVSPILNDQLEVVGFVGVEEDITDKKRAQQETEQKNRELEELNKLMVNRELRMTELKDQLINK